MIATLGWPTLEQRRTDSRLVVMYRIVHSMIDIPANLCLHSAAVSPYVIWSRSAVQTSTDTPSSQRPHDYETGFQYLSPQPRHWTASRQAWPLCTRRTCFYWFLSSTFIRLYSHSASMLLRGPCTFWEEEGLRNCWTVRLEGYVR